MYLPKYSLSLVKLNWRNVALSIRKIETNTNIQFFHTYKNQSILDNVNCIFYLQSTSCKVTNTSFLEQVKFQFGGKKRRRILKHHTWVVVLGISAAEKCGRVLLQTDYALIYTQCPKNFCEIENAVIILKNQNLMLVSM